MPVRRLPALVAALALAAVCAPAASAAPRVCDDIDIQGDPVSGGCMLPFPNDYFTQPDASTPTGRRLHFVLAAMPHNIAGKPIVPTDWNRADGFSPGSLIVARVPGLDNEQAFRKTGAVPDTDIARYLDRDQPVVLLDADTGKRWPIWSEVDESADNSPTANDNGRTFLIRPAKNLAEGHRYIVALRNLRDRDGNVLPAPPVFAAFRDGKPQANPLDESRRTHFEDLFRTLRRAGVARHDLYLAWDFTVASRQSLTGRMLAIRDDAFHQLGDDNLRDLKVQGKAPAFTITRIVDQTCGVRKQITDATGGNLDVYSPDLVIADASCDPGTNAQIVRDVKGTMTVPCYLSTPGCQPAHSHFLLGRGTDASPSGVPRQIPGNTMDVDFECRIPQSALDAGSGKSRPALYGHGLFGDYGEVRSGPQQAFGSEDNVTYCATSWEGMATHDVPNVVTILTDLSYFNTLADRVQQGMLNFLLLGRLMIHPDGLCTTAPFQTADGRCLLDTRRLYYDGNSQGGIIGGSLTAVAPDFTHAVLGVPGMNYSTLLTRSTDFGTGKSPAVDPRNPDLPEYALPLYMSYPNRLDRQLIFSLMQILWDRAEPDGYAEHMTDHPLPDTPAHAVMMHAALGDHQVANIAADVEARTIGAHLLRRPMVDPGRSADVEPFWGIPAWSSLPARGSTYVMWDSGSPVPPTTNTPPTTGADPHSHPRNTRAARDMKSAFLSYDSRVIDTCGGGSCYANGYHP